jgi:hypothetical protein
MKTYKPSAAQNASSIETIAGQVMALQMILEAVIIGDIRSGALSSELMTKVVAQGLEAFPNNKRLSDAELFGAIRTLNSITEAITAATTGGMPEK